jgi:predicted aspartyl protease
MIRDFKPDIMQRSRLPAFQIIASSEALMETDTMGRVLTAATIENLKDLWDAERGLIRADQVRRLELSDALVDTGATLLSLPTRLIRHLGLDKTWSKRVTSSAGGGEADIYAAVRLTIQGRSCTMDVMEVPDDVPVLIGQIPLEHLDFVVDLRSRSLIGNPAHGGEHVYELF